MSPIDESLLSAYVDGELDLDEQRAVESALASDPRLAQTVQDLLRVRELVAELPRPLSPDVSSQVMRWMHQRMSVRRTWSMARRYAPWSLGGIAAGILLLMILPYTRHNVVRPLGPELTSKNAASPEHVQPTLARSDNHNTVPSQPDTVDRQTSAGSRPASPHPDAALPSGNVADATFQARVGALLEDTQLRRVFLVTDRIGQPAENEVVSLVERTTHHDYYKITVSQGIVIDPHHPGKATVFAVVLDPGELDPFRKQLRDAFKDRLEDNEIDPAVTMQLVDIGQVVSLPAHPIADVTIPSATMALRAQAHPVPNAEPNSPLPAEPEPALPTPEQERSSPAAVLAQDDHLVVLVWITTPGSG